MKRSIAVFAATLSLGLCACSVPDMPKPIAERLGTTTSVSEAWQQIRSSRQPAVQSPNLIEDKVLTVGIRTNAQAPFSYKDNSGTYEGFDVTLAAMLADELGLDLKIVEVTGPAQTLGKTCDIVMNTQASDNNDYTVVGNYAQSASAFFSKGGQEELKVNDLSSKKLGVQKSSISQEAFKNTGLSMSEFDYDSINDLIAALNSGSVDYALADAYAGAYLATEYDDIQLRATLDAPKSIGIAVSKQNKDLEVAVQNALDNLSKKNCQLDMLRKVWFGKFTGLTEDSQLKDVPAPATPAITAPVGPAADPNSQAGH